MKIHVGNIILERFTAVHTKLLFELINTPEVRQGMRNSTPVSYESHVQWTQAHLLHSEETQLFVYEASNQANGVVLLKNITEHTAELGVMVENISNARKTQLTGKLLTAILHYGFQQLQLEEIHIKIIPENSNSIETALKIGATFQQQDETYRQYLLTKSQYQTFPLHQLLIKRYQPMVEES